MSNFMKRRFTTREIILLLVFLVILLIGLYFFLVFYPTKKDLEEIKAKQEEVEGQIDIQEIRKGLYDDMQAELDKLGENRSLIPDYDNIETLMIEFNRIFAEVEPQISYSVGAPNDGIIERRISFSFKAKDYKQAKSILTELNTIEYLSLMSNLTLSPSSGKDIATSELTVSGTMYFYERA